MFSSSAIEKLKSKKIYALEGNIGAGKTTIMKIICNHFNDVEFVEEPVSQWQNLGGLNLLDAFYTDPKRWGFSFEFYSLLTKIQALLKAAESDKPIIIIERSIFSNKIFMDLSKELGKLEKMEYRMLMNTYNFYLEHVYPNLSGIIYLDTPVEECTIEKSYLNALKNKMDEMCDSSTMIVIRIDGLYDCNRDVKRVCDDISRHLHPNESPKAVIPYDN